MFSSSLSIKYKKEVSSIPRALAYVVMWGVGFG